MLKPDIYSNPVCKVCMHKNNSRCLNQSTFALFIPIRVDLGNNGNKPLVPKARRGTSK